MTHVKDPTDVLREFVTDVKLAYGTGQGDEIDADSLDWPDLLTTYRYAVECIQRCDPEPSPKYEEPRRTP